MSLDIYRKTEIATASPEHVLQAGLGCNLKNSGLIDLQTNTDFGATIDKALVEDLTVPRCLLGFESRRGKGVAAQAEDSDFDLGSYGKPILKPKGRKPWNEEVMDDGNTHITVSARSMQEAKVLLGHILAAHKKDMGEIKDISAKHVRQYPPTMHLKFALGGPFSLRAVAKSVMNLMAHHLGPEVALATCFDKVRAYILEGVDRTREIEEGKDSSPAYANHESRPSFAGLAPQEFSAIEHRVLIRCQKAERTVYGLVELFGHLRFTVLLSDQWDGCDRVFGLFADPSPGNSKHTVKDLEPGLLPGVAPNFIMAHQADFDATQEAFRKMLEHLFAAIAKEQRSQSITDSMNEVLGAPDGRPLTPEMLSRLARDVAEMFVTDQFRIDTSEDIDPNELIGPTLT